MTRILCPLAALSLAATLTLAGPIDPPSGPIESTMKTLTEVEPRTAINSVNTPGDGDSAYVIDRPGHYYLTRDLPVIGRPNFPDPGLKPADGIEIRASNVTIDLNGFSLSGGSGARDGILTDGTYAALTIRNGTIGGFSGAGVRLNDPGLSIADVLIERVAVMNIGGDGIALGERSEVRDSRVENAGGDGISIEDRGVVERCEVRSSGGTGVYSPNGLTARDSIAELNGSHGFHIERQPALSGCIARDNAESGFFVGRLQNGPGNPGGTLTGCVATKNGYRGIDGGSLLTIRDCHAAENDDNGIYANNDLAIISCVSRGNGKSGIAMDSGIVLDSVSSNNATLGIDAAADLRVERCEIYGNPSQGIYARRGGATVIDCRVYAPTGNGIFGGNYSHIEGNTVSGGNGGPFAGISVGIEAHVEDNTVRFDGTGIEATGTDALIIKNRVKNLGNAWDIAPGNHYGPIINRSIVNSAGHTGDGDGVNRVGTSDPWANITY